MAELPSFEDMLLTSKKQKGAVSGLKDAINTLASTDLLELGDDNWEKLSQSDILCWLYAKFDPITVDMIRSLQSSPNSLISLQWLKFVSSTINFKQEQLEKIYNHLQPKIGIECVPLILCPPVATCYDCGNPLVKNRQTSIKVYSLQGYKKALKYTLRCKPCNIYYNYANFGNKHELGFRHYPTERNFVEASDTVYFSRTILNLQCSFA